MGEPSDNPPTSDAIMRHPVDQDIISLAVYLANRHKRVDIHTLTAAVRLRIPYTHVTPSQQAESKRWGLGALYGAHRFDWNTEPAETPDLLEMIKQLGELPEGEWKAPPPLPTPSKAQPSHEANARGFFWQDIPGLSRKGADHE